jgi:hypothetical protein
MDNDLIYAIADDTELDELLSGRQISGSTRWTQWSKPSRLRVGSVGVVWQGEDETIRPLVLIVNEDDLRHLCGRYAQLHSDLSPLTTWCHLLTPRFFEPLESLVRIPDLQGLQAAWTGLTIAEAMLLSEIPLARIKISACWATHSFAIARTNALWSHLTVNDITRRFDNANRLLKSESVAQRVEGRSEKIRTSLRLIWDALIGVSHSRGSHRSADVGPIVLALQGLVEARSAKDPYEANRLIRPLLSYVPEAESLERLNSLAPEDRLRIFDKLVECLEKLESPRDKMRRSGLGLIAGYLATVAAGGSSSLSLAEDHALRWPEIIAWAYVTGGIGENIVWTSSFDGLGRLVARELLRPLRLDEQPTCDFAFDEAEVLVDAKLTDPLVHLKVKQARVLTVELLPGVNVSIPIGETSAQSASKLDANKPARVSEPSPRDPLATLVDAMWPHIRTRLDEYLARPQWRDDSAQDDQDVQRNRTKRKPGAQPQLPLSAPKRY